jgi:hypothetical protein
VGGATYHREKPAKLCSPTYIKRARSAPLHSPTPPPIPSHSTRNQLQNATMNNDPNQKQDPLDKAFAAGAKKFGGAQGQKIAGNRATSEKIVRSFLLLLLLLSPIYVEGRRFADCGLSRPTAYARCTRRSRARRSTRRSPTSARARALWRCAQARLMETNAALGRGEWR